MSGVGESVDDEPIRFMNESKDRHTVRENRKGDKTNCNTLETLEENHYSSEEALKETNEEVIQINSELDLKIEQIIEKTDGVWKCKICAKTNLQNSYMRRHAESHIEGISHACHICSKSLSTRKSLKDHINKIHSELSTCDLCGKSGMNKMSYYTHKQKQHKTLSGTLSWKKHL